MNSSNTNNINSKIINIIIDTIIVTAIFLFLTNLMEPHYKPLRPDRIKNDCFSNIRVLYSAVELYNLDHETKINNLNEQTLNILLENQYIKNLPDPFIPKCKYVSKNDLASDSGIIYCEAHGSPDGTIKSIYGESEIYNEVSEKIDDNKKKTKYFIYLLNLIGSFIFVLLSRIFISGLISSINSILSFIAVSFVIFVAWIVFICIVSHI